MKKTLLTIALVAVTAAAFAQGKVSFANDTAHSYNLVAPTIGADPVGPIPNALPSGIILYAQLFAVTGDTDVGLTLKTSYALTGAGWLAPGRMTARALTLAGVPGGSIASLAVVVTDVIDPLGQLWRGGVNGTLPVGLPETAHYYGTSGKFTMTPGASITYPAIYNAGGTTWAGVPLQILAIPEPASFALMGLGAAALLIFRRRK